MGQVSDFDEPIPKWDVALEALAREEYKKKGAPLRLDDFSRLAKAHAIRLDDIMVTLFELVLNGEWRYDDAQQQARTITRDEVNRLYVNGRLCADDVRLYDGYWRPLG